MQNTRRKETFRLVLAAMFAAFGVLLPSVFHMFNMGGPIFLPMHIPVLLCGLVCGWKYGLLVGLKLLNVFVYSREVKCCYLILHFSGTIDRFKILLALARDCSQG